MGIPVLASYAAWLGGWLWIVGGLLERRSSYMLAESLRQLASVGGVIWTGSWLGPVMLPPSAQASVAIAIASADLLLALWLLFKPLPSSHGYLSRQ